MTRMVKCVKLGEELEALDRPPIKGDLGKRLYDEVSKDAWRQWITHSTMIINEYRLESGTPEAMKVWLAELDKFFFGEGSSLPDEFVAPDESKKDDG